MVLFRNKEIRLRATESISICIRTNVIDFIVRVFYHLCEAPGICVNVSRINLVYMHKLTLCISKMHVTAACINFSVA